MGKRFLTILGLSIASLAWSMPVLAHSEMVVVTITADGFSPAEVTVDQNSLVNFINKDTQPHWPASNPHPMHDLYPEFDPTHAIAPGDFWIFKPTRVGTWKYHDHLNPHRRGMLTVVAEADDTAITKDEAIEPQAATTTLPATRSRWERWQNWVAQAWSRLTTVFRRRPTVAATDNRDFKILPEAEQHQWLKQLQADKGADSVWQFVKDTYTNEAGASLGGQAHDLAHLTGGMIYKEKGLGGLTTCDPMFSFGCYHGFTEAVFATSLEQLTPVARACEAVGAINSGPWASCIHGIGHGVATYFNSTNFKGALQACDSLPAGKTYCYDGVFMEFAISAPPSFYTASDPLYPCLQVDERYAQACGRNQPHVMQRKFNMSRASVASACLTAPTAVGEACIDALGFGIANESHGNVAAIVADCRKLPTPAVQAQCVGAAAGELVFQNYPQWQTSAPALCNELPVEFRTACQQRVHETVANYRR